MAVRAFTHGCSRVAGCPAVLLCGWLVRFVHCLPPLPPQLMPLDKSRMHGVVNMRRHMLTELGWDPEWEVNPKELKLIEKIGEQCGGHRCGKG